MRPRTQDQRIAHHRGRSHESALEFVLRNPIATIAGTDDDARSLTVEEVQVTGDVDRRRTVFAADALAPDALSDLGVETRHHAPVADQIETAAIKTGEGIVGTERA